MADKEELMAKYKKKGVKFDKSGQPMGMKKIYESNPKLHKELIDNFSSSKAGMDDFNLRKFIGGAFKGDKK